MADRRVWQASGWLMLVGLVVCLRAGPARAQIGTGWTEFSPTKTIQLRGAGARYTNENGIETFSTQPGDERAEARIEDDHRTGTWQFEGWVNVKAGVNGGCVHQVFKFLMIVAYPNDGGELRQHSYQRLAATGIYDRWVRVNTIHDADAGRADVYIDGTWRGMTRSTSPGPNGWYHKYGIYNSSGTRPVVQWRNVRFFRGGKGDPSSVGADGGFASPDAQPDRATSDVPEDGPSSDGGPEAAVVGMDAGFGAGGTGGGSGGTDAGPIPGAGGSASAGRGGSGSGGRGGSGGFSAPAPMSEPGSSGCSCEVTAAPAPGGGLIAASLAGVLALVCRPRRRRLPTIRAVRSSRPGGSGRPVR